MKASDLMSGDVITVSPDTKIEDVAQKMVAHRISALPVVSADKKLVGLVTESDLLHRKEVGTERKRKWWFEFFVSPDERSREFAKSHGTRVEDVMTRVVVTVGPETELQAVADMLDKYRIRRVPVVDGGKLLGIVSRSDIVRALADRRAAANTDQATDVDDATLHKRVYDAIHGSPWIDTLYLNFHVENGVVDLDGFINSPDQRKALKVLIEEIPGVSEVRDNLRKRDWPIVT